MGELKDNIQLFEDKKIRTAWDAEKVLERLKAKAESRGRS